MDNHTWVNVIQVTNLLWANNWNAVCPSQMGPNLSLDISTQVASVGSPILCNHRLINGTIDGIARVRSKVSKRNVICRNRNMSSAKKIISRNSFGFPSNRALCLRRQRSIFNRWFTHRIHSYPDKCFSSSLTCRDSIDSNDLSVYLSLIHTYVFYAKLQWYHK